MTGNKNAAVRVTVAFRNIESTDALREYVTDKLTNLLKKFIHQDTEAHVTLKVEKLQQIAEVSFHCDGADFHGKEQSESLYAAIDALVDSLSQQLRKHKERMVSHHK